MYLTVSVLMLVLVLVLVLVQVLGEECLDGEIQEIQSQYNKCAVEIQYQYEDTRDTNIEEAACEMVSSILSECGAAWYQCYTEEEVQDLQDMHLESLLAQHSGVSLSGCPPVSQYLESGRRQETHGQETLCGVQRSVQGQQRFQMCSHSKSTEAYENIVDMDTNEEIQSILCDTLARIGSVCSKELEECFTVEDLIRMTRSHLQEMEKFLVKFADGKIGDKELSGCGEVNITVTEDVQADPAVNNTKELLGVNNKVNDINTDISEDDELHKEAIKLTNAKLYVNDINNKKTSEYKREYNQTNTNISSSVTVISAYLYCICMCIVSLYNYC